MPSKPEKANRHMLTIHVEFDEPVTHSVAAGAFRKRFILEGFFSGVREQKDDGWGFGRVTALNTGHIVTKGKKA